MEKMLDSGDQSWLEVTHEPAELFGMSKLYRQAIERRASAVIDALPEIRGYISSDLVEMLEQDKEASIPRLKEIASSHILDRAGINAAIHAFLPA
jgi:hypothetical protein